MSERREPSIRVTLLPKDTNVHGTIFGGTLLSYIDQAGAVAARCYSPQMVVTVAMKEVEFKKPVFVGDVISFYCDVTRVGRTSITVQVDVEAQRYKPAGELVKVTEAEVVYVAVDEGFNKVPIVKPKQVE